MLFSIFTFLLQLVGILGLLFALFVAFHVLRPQHSPADASNRINKIRLLWFCLVHEDRFVDVFPWLKNDETENVAGVK